MAIKTYYGICKTVATEEVKQVEVDDLSILEDSFNFNTGDLLVVYMTYTNEVAEPRIVVSGGDTELEQSLSDDTGKAIKTRNTLVDAVGAWDDGETVIFAYTNNLSGVADNTYYWELINGAPSTETVYGVTKLFGNEDMSIAEWMDTDTDTDLTTALTPIMLKRFYKLLTGDEEEEDPQIAPLVGLNWIPNGTGDLSTLGMLSLNTSGRGINITYPLTKAVQDIANPLITGAMVKRTSQLTNDGPPSGSTGAGYPYITTRMATATTLYAGSVPFLNTSDGTNNKLSIGSNSLQGMNINGGSGKVVTIWPNVKINGPLETTGNLKTAYITCTGINSTGNIQLNNKQLVTTGTIKAGVFEEGGTALKNKYSGKLWTRLVKKENLTINANSQTGHLYIDLAYSGWTPIGIVGFNLNYANASSTGDATWCHLWEQSITGGKLEFAIRNHKNAKVKIHAWFYILYVKNV